MELRHMMNNYRDVEMKKYIPYDVVLIECNQ